MKKWNVEFVLATTESLCPECLSRIPAERIAVGDEVYLDKRCPEHGDFRTIIWRGQLSYKSWAIAKPPSKPPVCATDVRLGCPFDCGLCPQHRQHTCCVLLEVTQRCNLACPICFAESRGGENEPAMKRIEEWYCMLLESGGPYNIQLSGGEPTLRDDLPDIIALGRSLGFAFIQLNTNGLRLANDGQYVRRLKEAGLGCVFLQFDGTSDVVYEKIRGKALLEVKKAAIAACAEQQIGVVLVPTLVPGVNTGDIGNMIEFAIERMPAVRGVHFQPVSYFGRYPKEPCNDDRVTIPEVINAIEQQTGGKMKSNHFRPPAAENAYCSFLGNFVLLDDGEFKAWTRDSQAGCCQPQVATAGSKRAQAFVAKRWTAPQHDSTAYTERMNTRNQMNVDSLDAFLDRVDNFSLCISGMAFQDAWNIDLERLRECFIHVVSPDSRIIPFCAYNLTDRRGKPLYRRQRSCQ
ncbi:MAG: radical SAM protein [Negativicutes bacterium]|nr:radical SAM protein [Negativicutes bacterium]